MKYIWQLQNWPKFSWKEKELLNLIAAVKFRQGSFLSKITTLGLNQTKESQVEILIEEAIKTSAIEGERLNRDDVRSSIIRKLGLSEQIKGKFDRSVDGLIEVLLDANQRYDKTLTTDRIKGWQAALFPSGYSHLSKIEVGKWRTHQQPMQVVSGPVGKEKAHYQAPPSKKVNQDMKHLLKWFNQSEDRENGLIRAGLVQLWFVTIHPFEDGNGRIARALTDLALSQDEKMQTRYYSVSSQIMEERANYYRILEATQKGTLDITEWLKWFLECLSRAITNSEQILDRILMKAIFWQKHNQKAINENQRKVINKMLDAGKNNFQGGLTNKKYISMTRVSRTTAYRDIEDLIKKDMLLKSGDHGRSTNYEIKWIRMNQV